MTVLVQMLRYCCKHKLHGGAVYKGWKKEGRRCCTVLGEVRAGVGVLWATVEKDRSKD